MYWSWLVYMVLVGVYGLGWGGGVVGTWSWLGQVWLGRSTVTRILFFRKSEISVTQKHEKHERFSIRIFIK